MNLDPLDSTFEFYSDEQNAELFFERWRHRLPEAQIGLLLEKIALGASILDAGCGPGHHANFLVRQGYQVTGLDQSNAALEIARRSVPTGCKPNFILGDMRRIVMPDCSFDAVWASGSLIHSPREQLAKHLSELIRVLKPGGVFAFTMQTNRIREMAADGRFFEGYTNVGDITDCLGDLPVHVLDVGLDTTRENTHYLPNEVQWSEIVVRKSVAMST